MCTARRFIAIGKTYDQVSLDLDSDIFSRQGAISDWIPAPESIFDPVEEEALDPSLDDLEVVEMSQDSESDTGLDANPCSTPDSTPDDVETTEGPEPYTSLLRR